MTTLQDPRGLQQAICKYCHKPFWGRKGRLYCSKKHANKHQIIKEKLKPPDEIRICPFCRVKFEIRLPRQKNKRYCTTNCAVKFRYHHTERTPNNSGSWEGIGRGDMGREEVAARAIKIGSLEQKYANLF